MFRCDKQLQCFYVFVLHYSRFASIVTALALVATGEPQGFGAFGIPSGWNATSWTFGVNWIEAQTVAPSNIVTGRAARAGALPVLQGQGAVLRHT